MGMFPVSPEKEKALKERMSELGIKEEDILETFVRSSGKGGQNVNKTSTCVHLKHTPTKTEIKCGIERSQGLNRYRARVMLAGRLDLVLRGKESEGQRAIEKIRKKKKMRLKRAMAKYGPKGGAS